MSNWLLGKRISWSLLVTLVIPLTALGAAAICLWPTTARLPPHMLDLNRQPPSKAVYLPQGRCLVQWTRARKAEGRRQPQKLLRS